MLCYFDNIKNNMAGDSDGCTDGEHQIYEYAIIC